MQIREQSKPIFKVQFRDGTWHATTSKKKHRELLILAQSDMDGFGGGRNLKKNIYKEK